jgi:glucosamine-6-phosphate deaminase
LQFPEKKAGNIGLFCRKLRILLTMQGTNAKIMNAIHRKEKIPVQIFETSAIASRAVAEEVAQLIKAREAAGIPCVLGLATGSTPKTVYAELIRMHREEGLSFKNVVTFNLDEYFPMHPEDLQSYVRFMNDYLFDHIDIQRENIHIPDGSLPKDTIHDFCQAYEEKIRAFGGIDLQLLGIGRTGHIGFNEPGSGLESRTRLITLDYITRLDASSDFFGEENVPTKAITMGVGTIMEAKKVILMAWGENKASIVARTVEGSISDTVPATYLQNHPNTSVVLDDGSSAQLTRVKLPWTVGEVAWDDRLIKRAVTWLSLKQQKPILKLTNRDYMDNGMTDLVTEYDTAYNINIRIFNQLQRTITGWPGGKPNADDTHRPERAEPAKKRVIVFSPHPDDDVISMGGTLIRLHDQGHEVHVAYQTSGNIAVFDEDVVRFADFVNDYHEVFGLRQEVTKSMFLSIREKLKSKLPGNIDPPEVQKIKGLIRRGEAKAACRYVGIEDKHVHFLDLPFYETGLVKKKPLGKDDITIMVELLQAVRPHQIFAAGDLSDPHGTHRVCLNAVFMALDHCKQESWIKDCYLWLYRGAWQEWDIEDVEMAVPLSPDELLKKRRAIFKHQSQKDRPLFPGSDAREFWQRSESRNRATAEIYDKLGLAEYEAIEAFKRYHF